MKINVLMVEPNFPKPSKSKNHNDFMPIGLLKIAAFHRNKGNRICLVRGEVPREEVIFESQNGQIKKNSNPDKILITSYFTYWSNFVKKSVSYYRKMFPLIPITVGGIYASLMPDHCKQYTGCDEVHVGLHEKAENVRPAYAYLEKHFGPKDYQILHTSRGCIRTCRFCGVYKIEPDFTFKQSIRKEIKKRKLIFYDNNLLANPHIKEIFTELTELKRKKRILLCEAQSGIDGRLILKDPELASLLKSSSFRNIRISWDGRFQEHVSIKKQIDLLKRAGYNIHENVFIFMIYNWDIPIEEMEKKRLKCWDWKVQISDCRYRPLNQTFDNYSGQAFRKGQTSDDYYIHKRAGWTDDKIRMFRKHIRRQNMCIRFNSHFYVKVIERSFLNKYVTKEIIHLAKKSSISLSEDILKSLKISYWYPENYNGNGHQISKEEIYDIYERETNMNAIVKNHESFTFQRWRNKIQRNALTVLYKQQNRPITF